MSTEAIINEYEERLRSAQLTSDLEELSVLVDDEVIFSALDGGVVGKKDDLNLHKSPDFQITKMEVLDRVIKCFDNTAVVNVLMDVSASVGGNVQEGEIRYIRVWHKFPEGWRIISGGMNEAERSVTNDAR